MQERGHVSHVLMKGGSEAFLDAFRGPSKPLVLQLGALRIVAAINGLFIALVVLVRLRKMSVVRLDKR